MWTHQKCARSRSGVGSVERFGAAGLWRLADPKISLAPLSSRLLGTALAAPDGDLSIVWLAVTVAGIFALEIAKNASGEIYDFAADSSVEGGRADPFPGGKRVLVDGLLTRRETAAIAAIGYPVAVACGMAIVLWREPAVLETRSSRRCAHSSQRTAGAALVSRSERDRGGSLLRAADRCVPPGERTARPPCRRKRGEANARDPAGDPTPSLSS
jgi:hypothetical protein